MPTLTTTGLPLLSALPFAAALFLIGTALGRRVLRMLGARAGSTAEKGAVAFTLGTGLLVWLPFSLGAAGVLSVSSLRISLGILTLFLALDLVAVARAASQFVTGWSPKWSWELGWKVALLPAFVTALLLALAPTIDPDGLAYHLTVPKRWLMGGSLAYLPTYPYSNTPMGVEMLFMIALAFGGDAAAKIAHFMLGASATIGVYLAGCRVRGNVTGALAAIRYAVGPAAVTWLLGMAFCEGATSSALVAASLAWMLWFRERDAGWLRAAALLAGVAVSYKLTAAVFPIGLSILTWIALDEDSREKPRGVVDRSKIIAALVPWVILPLLPWLVRSAVVTGNPVFPMFAGLIPSRDFSPRHAAQFEQYNRYMVWAGASADRLGLGARKAILFGCAAALVIIGAISVIRLRSRLARGTAIVLVIVCLAQLLGVGLYVRYWIPLLAVVQIPVLALLEPYFATRASRILLVGLSLIGSSLQMRKMLKDISNDVPGLVKTAAGVEPQRTFVTQQVGLFPLYELANRVTPENAGILLSNNCGGFYIDRKTFCAEFVQDSLRYDTWEHFIEDARRLGITYVIAPRTLATGESPPEIGYGNSAVIVRPSEFVVLARLLSSRGKLLDQALDQGLYAVTLPEIDGSERQP